MMNRREWEGKLRVTEKVVGIVAALALAAMMLISVADVVGRTGFGKPLHGATELTEICMMLVTFLMFPLVALRRLHIKVDLLEQLFTKSVMAIQTLVTGVLGGGIFTLVTYRTWVQGWRSIGYGDVTMGLEIPVGYIFLFMSVLSGLTALGFFASVFIRAPARTEDEGVVTTGAI